MSLEIHDKQLVCNVGLMILGPLGVIYKKCRFSFVVGSGFY